MVCIRTLRPRERASSLGPTAEPGLEQIPGSDQPGGKQIGEPIENSSGVEGKKGPELGLGRVSGQDWVGGWVASKTNAIGFSAQMSR